MFPLFNNKTTIYLRPDVLEWIQHKTQIIILNDVKHFQLMLNSSNVVME